MFFTTNDIVVLWAFSVVLSGAFGFYKGRTLQGILLGALLGPLGLLIVRFLPERQKKTHDGLSQYFENRLVYGTGRHAGVVNLAVGILLVVAGVWTFWWVIETNTKFYAASHGEIREESGLWIPSFVVLVGLFPLVRGVMIVFGKK